ncbi:MAG: CapA family protein [Dysgonamonadaceae bacterium]|jgi:poly-gamma-glutamate capsule biosynthesis protein CapA/YwtB (metallophosphatase superfamily)|nr:CapA family protein [Dysgonamonadaceae bacterium]
MTYLKVLVIGIVLALSIPIFAQPTEDERLISVIGVGDIMLGSNYPSEAKLPVADGKELLSRVSHILQDADVTSGNLEGCILNQGGNVKACKSGCYFFRMPERYVSYLVDAGFDVLNIANNHNGDFGVPGRENTVKTLKNAGLHYAGLKNICETSRFEINGIKYGFCGFAPNTGTVKITDIGYAKQLVSELKQDCDIVIVSFHGGAEGKAHNRVTRKTETFYGENRGNVYEFAHAVVDAGADIVFGHGPHVVRAAELYKDRFIIYSLGNFCTAGDFSISGISGYAPIVKVYTDITGKFVKGQIFSAVQKDKTGPVLDDNHSAAKEIKRLSGFDFPSNPLLISDDGTIERKENTVSVLDTGDRETLAQNIIDYSRQFLNKPYRRGYKGPDVFDCSGFTSFVFNNFGLQLTSGCITQINQGTKIAKENVQTGDLIFFKGRNVNSSRIGHVGIVTSNDEGRIRFIHACLRGVIEEELNQSKYYKSRYVTGLRVLS